MAVLLTHTCKEQTQIVIDLGDRSYRRARVFRSGLLIDGNSGGQPLYLVYIRLAHTSEELTCIARERLYVTPLSLRIECRKCQCRFT